MPTNPSTQIGISVSTNYIWDIQQLQKLPIDQGLKELLIRLYQNLGQMADVLNKKDTGIYQLIQTVNSQTLFANPVYNSSTPGVAIPRQIYRTVVNFGALPNTAAKSVAHNIICNTSTMFTRIYATASDQTGFNYIPIPYASASGTDNIELSVDATDVTITTASNRSNFNQCIVVLEYVQS